MNIILFIVVALTFVLNIFISLELIKTKAYLDAYPYQIQLINL